MVDTCKQGQVGDSFVNLNHCKKKPPDKSIPSTSKLNSLKGSTFIANAGNIHLLIESNFYAGTKVMERKPLKTGSLIVSRKTPLQTPVLGVERG